MRSHGLAGDGISVSRAAYAVGHVSPLQFSREDKSLSDMPRPATGAGPSQMPAV